MEMMKIKLHPVFYVLTFAGIVVVSAIINRTMNNKAPEIESPEVIKAIVNVFRSVDNELQVEHMRSKSQYLEKYGLREIKTNKTRTALEQ
jgi:uncharacterized protein (DUF362 family)